VSALSSDGGPDRRRDGETALREAIGSSDIARTQRVIAAWAEELRDPGGERDSGADARTFADACAPLASHVSPKIRESVAGAADVVPEEVFDAWLARFTADEDHYVRAAIKRAAKRRAIRRKARAKHAEHDMAVADLLQEIESTYDKNARRLAERVLRRATSSFVRRLHHEASKIATPLEFSLHRLRSELARPTPDRPVLAHNVGIACDRYRHLWSIIDRARDATATITPCFEDEPLLPLIQEARAQLVDRIGPRVSRLAFVVEVAPALRLDLDRSALLEALQNFLQNAVEAYAEDAPRIAVSIAARTLRAGSQVEISIADRGMGMSEYDRDQMFVPFGSRKPGGTGVGLLIARTMIEEVHGGSLKLESARDVGTTVTFVLPARQSGRAKS
jgi:signal transduction histidine kinase